jgi:hypothetical protein
MDVRRFITAVYYLSPLTSTWGNWQNGNSSDPTAFFRWFKIRAKIVFATLIALTDGLTTPQHGAEVGRVHAVAVFGEEKGGQLWDKLFDVENPPRTFNLTEFRDLIVASFFPPPSSLVPPSSIITEEEEEIWKKKTKIELEMKRQSATTLLNMIWERIDENWKNNVTKLTTAAVGGKGKKIPIKAPVGLFLLRKDEERGIPEQALEDPIVENPGDDSTTMNTNLINNKNNEGGV